MGCSVAFYATGGIRSSQWKLALFTTERQRALQSAKAFSKTSFKHRSVQIKGNEIVFYKFITYYAYYFAQFIFNNPYPLLQVSNGNNSVTVQNRTHVYIIS